MKIKMVLRLMLLALVLMLCGQAFAEQNECRVVLEYNDGASRPHTLYVQPGTAIDMPDEPLRKGYTFAGWYTKADGNEAISFPLTVTTDTTLHAVWTANLCTITLDYGYDGLTETVEAAYGTSLAAPEVPARNGYILYQWRNESGTAMSFPVEVKRDMVCSAEWISDGSLYEISVDLNYEGAPAMDTLTIQAGEKITARELSEPVREGFTFAGWSLTSGSEAVALPYEPVESCTLYANWEEAAFQVTFRNNYTGAAERDYAVLPAGSSGVNPPAEDPVRAGFVFTGWYRTSVGGEQVEFPFNATRNTTVYAHWIAEPVETNIFHAEYVQIDPTEKFPGYSGEATGHQIILDADVGGILTDTSYPVREGQRHRGYYVSYLYKRDATLTFVISSTEDVTGATLIANLGVEIQPNIMFGPTGSCAYSVIVNGEAIEYKRISFRGDPSTAGAAYKSDFQEFVLFEGLNLKAGENVIQLVTANDNGGFGGTMRAVAPMVDYIKIENYGTAVLSWSPDFDNLNRR